MAIVCVGQVPPTLQGGYAPPAAAPPAAAPKGVPPFPPHPRQVALLVFRTLFGGGVLQVKKVVLPHAHKFPLRNTALGITELVSSGINEIGAYFCLSKAGNRLDRIN